MSELETENAALRERVTQLDERTNALSKEVVRAKFRGQQQASDYSNHGRHRRRKGSVVGGHMASAEHEPITCLLYTSPSPRD